MTIYTEKRKERGVALLMALFSLIVVTSIALGMMYLTDTETLVNSNFRDEQAAFYAARAGLEESRERMRSGSTGDLTTNLPTAQPGSVNGVLYILNPTGSETVAPWTTTNAYFDDEICKEIPSSCSGSPVVPSTTNWYVGKGLSTSTPALTANSTYAASPTVLPYKWMRLTLKTNSLASGYSGATHNYYYVDGNSAHASYYTCWDGKRETASSTACSSTTAPFPVYMATALAVGSGGTRRLVQYELTRDNIQLTLPGALTIDGPIASGAATICGSGATCNSGGDYITGHPNVAGCGSDVPGIATADSTSDTNLTTAIMPNHANIAGLGGTASAPSVADASSSLTSLNTVAEVEAMVTKFKALAGSNVGSDCTTLNLGTAASPTITVVTNDPVSSGVSGGVGCNLNSGTTGYGIMVVTGSLQYVNLDSYQGVILMLGTAQFVSSSSKDTRLTGALFMAQTRNASTGALLSSLGTPTFNFHHGSTNIGDPSIQYNLCTINSVTSLTNYKMLSQRELMY